MKQRILNILAYDALNRVEIYRGQDNAEADRAVDRYCDFMGLVDESSIRIEVIYT